MSIHEKQINKSIDVNIIGTSNLVKICNTFNKKLIFFSPVMFTQEKKGIIKRVILCYLGIIMVGQN